MHAYQMPPANYKGGVLCRIHIFNRALADFITESKVIYYFEQCGLRI
jgi:hypothetical protein